VRALCDAPGEAALETARVEFSGLVEAWSAIALVRFGPVAEANRFERMWFFPDRRGLALKQVQALLAASDPAAIEEADFVGKSVAVQGLPALEYALHGDGAETLTDGRGGYRCRFAAAVAANIAAIAKDLAMAWGPDGAYPALLRKAGPANPAFRSHEEAVRALIGAMTGELQLARTIKLLPVLGETADKAKPKSAAFWRSGQALASVRANVEAVFALYQAGGFSEALGPDAHWVDGAIRFELGNAIGALEKLAETPVADAVAGDDTRALIGFAAIALHAAQEDLLTHYAEGAGLTLGFNSLDGD